MVTIPSNNKAVWQNKAQARQTELYVKRTCNALVIESTQTVNIMAE